MAPAHSNSIGAAGQLLAGAPHFRKSAQRLRLARRLAVPLALWNGLLLAGLPSAAPKPPAFPRSPAPAVAPAWPRSAQLASFQLADQVSRRFSTEYTLTNGMRVLKLEVLPNVDRTNAEVLVQESLMNLEALYASALSPYPGDISKQVVSDARFQPQFVATNVHGLTYRYYLVYANERFGYGAVTPDVVKYRSLVGWFYCEPVQRLYKLRYFVPLPGTREELESLFLSCTCP